MWSSPDCSSTCALFHPKPVGLCMGGASLTIRLSESRNNLLPSLAQPALSGGQFWPRPKRAAITETPITQYSQTMWHSYACNLIAGLSKKYGQESTRMALKNLSPVQLQPQHQCCHSFRSSLLSSSMVLYWWPPALLRVQWPQRRLHPANSLAVWWAERTAAGTLPLANRIYR